MNDWEEFLYSIKKLEDFIRNEMQRDCEVFIVNQSLPLSGDKPDIKPIREIDKSLILDKE